MTNVKLSSIGNISLGAQNILERAKTFNKTHSFPQKKVIWILPWDLMMTAPCTTVLLFEKSLVFRGRILYK